MMTHTSSSIMILLFNILYIDITLSATCDYNACVYVKNECEFSLYNHRFLTVLESNDETVFDISSWYGEGSEDLDVWYGNPVDGKADHSTVFINYGCYNEEKMCYTASTSGLAVQIGPYNKADCPEIDDVSQQGGYKECSTDFLSVTFCADATQSDYDYDYDYDEMVPPPDIINNNNNEPIDTPSRLLNDEMERIKYYSNNNNNNIYNNDEDYEMMELHSNNNNNNNNDNIYNNDEMNYDEMMESDSNNDNNNNNKIKSFDGACLSEYLSEGIYTTECNGEAEQKWIYNNTNGIIKNENGHCLDVELTHGFGWVHFGQCTGQKNQKWHYQFGHIVSLISLDIGSNLKCLESRGIGGVVFLPDCNNNNTQSWMIESHSMEPSTLLNDNYDEMIESDSNDNNNNNIYIDDEMDYDEMVASPDSEASLLLNDEIKPIVYYDEMELDTPPPPLLNDEMERIKYYSNNNNNNNIYNNDEDYEMMKLHSNNDNIYNNDEMKPFPLLNDDYDEMMESDSNTTTNNNIESFDGKCLSEYLSAGIYTTECNGEAEQTWIYDNGIIKNENGYCLDSNDGDLLYSKCTGQDNQTWSYQFGHIVTLINGNIKCLDIENINGYDIVILSDCNNNNSQSWIIG